MSRRSWAVKRRAYHGVHGAVTVCGNVQIAVVRCWAQYATFYTTHLPGGRGFVSWSRRYRNPTVPRIVGCLGDGEVTLFDCDCFQKFTKISYARHAQSYHGKHASCLASHSNKMFLTDVGSQAKLRSSWQTFLPQLSPGERTHAQTPYRVLVKTVSRGIPDSEWRVRFPHTLLKIA